MPEPAHKEDPASPASDTATAALAGRPSPNNPPWTTPMAFGFWIVSVFLIVALPSLLLIPYLMRQGVALANNPGLRDAILADPLAVSISLGSTLLAHIITIALAWAIVTNFNRYSFTEMLGWKWGGFRLWHGAAILVVVYGLALALTALLGSKENEMTRILESSRLAVVLVAIIATLSAPVVEEVVYRGILYSAVQRTFNVPVATIVVTVIFAAVHFQQYYPDFATIIAIGVLSLAITLIRARTDNLLPCIVFHMVFNGIQSMLLILEPYVSVPDQIQTLPDKGAPAIHAAVSSLF